MVPLDDILSISPEEGVWELTLEGELPAYLGGTYYLNGPGRFARGDFRYHHWLDGDGLLRALRINGAGSNTVAAMSGPGAM